MDGGQHSARFRIGIDTGGTFTDIVLVDASAGTMAVTKVSSTPDNPARGLVNGVNEILGKVGGEPVEVRALCHGTTVATNALLERRGARMALLTTAGFKDVLLIGRQNRPHIYRLFQERPPMLVPDDLRLEVIERLAPDGSVLTPLDEADLANMIEKLADLQPESVAIVLLYAFQNPAHERRVAQLLAAKLPDLPRSLSSEILPEYREYERTATTVVNAYVQPLVGRYLDRLAARLPGTPIRIMQSNGGAIGLAQAAEQPARLVLSGPAGGVVGAFELARQAQGAQTPVQIITFDMGGTSTDVALCPGHIPHSAESEIAGLPLRLPIIDIHTVGAGGGSLAQVDPGGALRVGPHSAGAVPGPVCYGRGGVQATVTDANLVLGRLDAAQFLGGEGAVGLDEKAALIVLTQLGQELGGRSAHEAALGIVRVANAVMERALRQVSVERGHDPRRFALVPFGGAGPLHACDLADALGIRHIFLPPSPGVLSALGLLLADVVYDTSHAVLRLAHRVVEDLPGIEALFADQADQVRAVLAGEGFADPDLAASLDMRYQGQSYELSVPLALPITSASVAGAVDAFHAAHAQRYGYAMPDQLVEVVTLRVRGSGPGARPTFARHPLGEADPSPARLADKPVWFDAHGPTPTACYDRSALGPGHRFVGPAMIFQFDTTTVVPPGWSARVDGLHNIWLAREDSK